MTPNTTTSRSLTPDSYAFQKLTPGARIPSRGGTLPCFTLQPLVEGPAYPHSSTPVSSSSFSSSPLTGSGELPAMLLLPWLVPAHCRTVPYPRSTDASGGRALRQADQGARAASSATGWCGGTAMARGAEPEPEPAVIGEVNLGYEEQPPASAVVKEEEPLVAVAITELSRLSSLPAAWLEAETESLFCAASLPGSARIPCSQDEREATMRHHRMS